MYIFDDDIERYTFDLYSLSDSPGFLFFIFYFFLYKNHVYLFFGYFVFIKIFFFYILIIKTKHEHERETLDGRDDTSGRQGIQVWVSVSG